MNKKIFSKLNTSLNPIRKYFEKMQRIRYSKFTDKYSKNISFTEASQRFPNRNELYAYMHHHFHNLCPTEIRKHREYFLQERRGFGEDAFHAMWFTLLSEFRPKKCLEIGVYRGQVVSLWALIARNLDFNCSVHGVSPFTSVGDEVSDYMRNIDYLEDTLLHHRHFGLNKPNLIRALSTDNLAVQYIQSSQIDLIYIDGNHDYEVALADYLLCKESLVDGGLLVMDDSSLHSDFQPPRFAFAGHPGPSRVVQERAMKEMRFLGGVGHNNVFQKI
jgi:hypothetical protein